MENGRGLLLYLSVVILVYSVQLVIYPKYSYNRTPIRIVEEKLLEFDLLERRHAVVIDAGSTGSRVLAFSFYTSFIDGDLVLFDELWHEEKPGLSSYADQPHLAAQSVQKLISIAKERIPEKFHSLTPISLKATAGLRLLPELQANQIIDNVKTVLKTSGFIQLKNDPGVEIMSDLEEGICGWMTVNFLLDLVNTPEETAAALDLGGGSTQISFIPTWASTINESDESFIVDKDIDAKQTKFYSHSYLGLGLMAARKGYLKTIAKKEKVGDEEIFKSVCFNKDVTWTQKDGIYKVKPSDDKESSVELCVQQIKSFVQTKDVHSPEELKHRRLVAFSYFYDRAVDAGIIPESGGVISVSQFKQAGASVCKNKEASDFLCFDLSYLYVLLSSYGLSDSNEISVYKKINGHETSWALGLALQLLA